MRKTAKLNAKSIVNEIVTVAGVSKANAENIFNLFSTAWNTNRVGLLTVLDAGIVTTKKAARKAGPKAAKKPVAKVAPKTAKATVPAVKTAKKTAPASTAKKPLKLKKKVSANSTGESSSSNS